ncbi:DUF262 domain-containing protein [Photobacterium sp. NCIMB 13483]|uniref:DUF262 domain-containing protein n=1 Tax=Photobacterium sp. NCIMB 13483 TaxID=2022103 RepID=UPI000D157FBC|nr:DUF262 domain-containing protein [Photobacterium sp. NCIMB 13483]PST93656.1 DUF262 domain-containing protein [Photobacterium sp. NCIMB 13483]
MDNTLFEDVKEELSESGEKIGIEAENDEDVIEPFDPEEISIQQRVVSMDVIIRRLKQGSIQLAPSFQRNEVWDITRKSRLIESLMLNIPLPMFYVASDEKSQWEVVDGLQRLSTIRDFMIGDKNGEMLRLKNLEFLGEKYEGKTFLAIENEPSAQKLVNDIYETEMRFTVINPGTPEAVKRNIFKRINTGGMPLTTQEIRHALYEGISSKLLKELVTSPSFKGVIGKKINDSRMGVSELMLRLIAFMVMDRSAYKSGMDSWLSNAMRVINCFPDPTEDELNKIFQKNEVPKLNITSVEEIKEKFILAINRSEEIFDGHAFRKSLPNEYRKSPINKSLFEVWGNILSDLSEYEYEILKSNKYELIESYSELLKKLEFNNAISRHSSTQKGIIDSFNSIKELVLKNITDCEGNKID